MMSNIWYDSFLEALYKKFPKKSALIEALMNLLSIERETVYRRLRKEVMFPMEEVIKIASAWNISLDEIIGINTGKVFFKVKFIDYFNPSSQDLDFVEKEIYNFRRINSLPDMEYMEVSNNLPRALVSGFTYLNRYQLFKWMHHYHTDSEKVLPYSQNVFSPKMSELILDFHRAMKEATNTIYIWDQKLFEYLVRDIHYFHSIYLITEEEKNLIKKDLSALLDYMSEVAIKGYWPETGKKVELYISYVNIYTGYSYNYSNEFKESRIHAFMKNEVYSDNPMLIEGFKTWMQSKKRSSIQISKADEKNRIEFFMKQHHIINNL